MASASELGSKRASEAGSNGCRFMVVCWRQVLECRRWTTVVVVNRAAAAKFTMACGKAMGAGRLGFHLLFIQSYGVQITNTIRWC